MDLTSSDPTGAGSVRQLLQRRAQILEWLQRLDDVGSEAEARVVQRVRADYQERLEQVLRELGEHQDGLLRDLDELRDRVRLTRERHESAVDALEESRLRHRIGEIGAEEWEERRPALEAALAESEEARDEADAELERLEELLSHIQSDGEAAAAETATVDPWLDLPILAEEEPEEPPYGGDGDGLAAPDPLGGDAAEAAPAGFLEELDRALGSGGGADGEGDDIDTRPPRGVKCPDCGYTNDANAWFCGVCGVDLA